MLGQTVVAEGEQRLEQIFVVAAVVGQIVVVGEPHQVQIFVVAVGEVVVGVGGRCRPAVSGCGGRPRGGARLRAGVLPHLPHRTRC